MNNPTDLLPTVGQIAHEHDVPIHRVEYIIRSRGICPRGWAGNSRVFSDVAIEKIAEELSRIDDVKGRIADCEWN